MYLNIRVGVRVGKAGRPPLRLSVAVIEAHDRVVMFSSGLNSPRSWRVKAAFEPAALSELERHVASYAFSRGQERQRTPVRVPARIAVEGPVHTLRAGEPRPNHVKRLYVDGLFLHRQSETLVARWFDGSYAFEISGDDYGWAEFFAGLRSWLGPDLGANPSTISPCADADADKRAHACVAQPTVTVSGVTVPA